MCSLLRGGSRTSGRGSTIVCACKARAQKFWPCPKIDKPRLLNCRYRWVLHYFLAVQCSTLTKFWTYGLSLVCFCERTSWKRYKMLKFSKPTSHFCWMGGSLLGGGGGGGGPRPPPPPPRAPCAPPARSATAPAQSADPGSVEALTKCTFENAKNSLSNYNNMSIVHA